MKALKIIPALLVLLLLVYLGMLFVEANQEPVIISIGTYNTPAMRLGFVVMTSALIGITIGALLASAQIALLLFQNRSLRKKLERSNHSSLSSQWEAQEPPAQAPTPAPSELPSPESEKDPFAP